MENSIVRGLTRDGLETKLAELGSKFGQKVGRRTSREYDGNGRHEYRIVVYVARMAFFIGRIGMPVGSHYCDPIGWLELSEKDVKDAERLMNDWGGPCHYHSTPLPNVTTS